MSEDKPREFWIDRVQPDIDWEVSEHFISSIEPNPYDGEMSLPDAWHFRDSLHVVEYSAYEKLSQELEQLKAQNQKYKEALGEILKQDGTPPEFVVEDCHEIAREALKGEE